MQKVLVTGAAGFIGFFLTQQLIERGFHVVGYDNLNSYYDVALKEARLALLQQLPHFQFIRANLEDRKVLLDLFAAEKFDYVVHLAAQAGVRYSLENPFAYVDSNLVGFINILEGCRAALTAAPSSLKHLVFASSSSVYGANTKVPFSTDDSVDRPVSLYAASKKANELMAHSYAHLFNLPSTGLRFFTVYGPWGRPDMALFSFTKAIFEGRPIQVFNHGNLQRDFTYVDDVVEGVIRTMLRIPTPEHSESFNSHAPYKIYNIGNNSPVPLIRFIDVLESAIGIKAVRELLPMQPGDVLSTYANVDDLARDVDFRPKTSIEDGIQQFVRWYREFYRIS